MRHSLSRTHGFDITVDDSAALPLSPEGTPALPLITGPRLAVTGRIGPRCRNCRDFQTVVTRHGTASCKCVTTRSEDKPPLPMRPQPHERDGRQPASEPGRSHPRQSAQLTGGRA